MKPITALFLTSSLIICAANQAIAIVTHGTRASASACNDTRKYVDFSVESADSLVKMTSDFMQGKRTVAKANHLTQSIQAASLRSKPLFESARVAAKGNDQLIAAIDAFRQEELRLPMVLANTDETELGTVTEKLVSLKERALQECSKPAVSL